MVVLVLGYALTYTTVQYETIRKYVSQLLENVFLKVHSFLKQCCARSSVDTLHRGAFSGGFITAIVNPPERKLAKRTSVQCDGRPHMRIEHYSKYAKITNNLEEMQN